MTLRFLSLKQRCAVLLDKFGLKIGVHGLTNIYKRAGIQYRFARPQARKYLTPSMHSLSQEVIETRREAADQLLDILASNQAVAFVDECTIQSQQKKMKTWMHHTREILQPQASVSCTITIYVCISNIHAGPHFMLGSSTNSRDFKRFLEEIRWARTDSMDAPYTLVLDGKNSVNSTHTQSLTPFNCFRCHLPSLQGKQH